MLTQLSSETQVIDLITPFIDDKTIIGSLTLVCKDWVRYRGIIIKQKYGKSQKLNLGRNGLTSIPKELENLHNLQQLYLGDNALTSIPKELGNLHNLQHLFLYSNALTSIPKRVENLHPIKVRSP